MIADLVFVIGGLAILLFSGDLLVRGSVAFAERSQMPPMLIGLTIVAFGTSAPELVIGVDAALRGPETAGIALGNVVGSNIANILVVLGIPALIYPTVCDQPTIRRTTVLMVGASLLMIWMCLNAGMAITRGEGWLLFVLMIAFLCYAAYKVRSGQDDGILAEEIAELEGMQGLPKTAPRIAAFILIAIVGLPLGSHLIVEGARSLAEIAGISPTVIGLSLIAFGTSLPELATTVIAAFNRHCGVALGNVLGSNLFNILGILGLSAMVAQEPIAVEARFAAMDLWVMLACALVIVPFAFRHWTISRIWGLIFLVAYGVFLVVLFDTMAA